MKLQLIIATGNENKVREIREILVDPDLTVISMAQAGIESDPDETGTTFEENALIKVRAAAEVFRKKYESPVETGHPGVKNPSGGSHCELLFAQTGDGLWKPDPDLPLAILADDSGLVVDALGGMPGIYSARYLGRDTSYEYKMRHIMDEMRDVRGADRSARFTCACAAMIPARWLRRDFLTGGDAESSAEKSPVRCSALSADWAELVVVRSMEGEIAREIAGGNGFGYDPFFYLPDVQKTSAEVTEEEKNAISHRGKAFRAMLQELRGIISGAEQAYETSSARDTDRTDGRTGAGESYFRGKRAALS